MGLWNVGVDELANSRFAISPLAESVGALAVLHRGAPGPTLGAWRQEHLTAYRERIADPADAAVVDAVLRPKWIADFVALPPDPADKGIADELARMRATPATRAHEDVLAAAQGRRLDALHAIDLVQHISDVLEWVWTHTVRPDWPRRRRLLEADIVARTSRLTSGGWAAALDDLRPGMRWLGNGRLQINAYDYPPADLAGAQLAFVPCTTATSGWVAWSKPHSYAVVYPCVGVLAEADTVLAPQPLSRLLGAARATVLTALRTPASTSQLVALTGSPLGSVGGHLAVLRDAGLVQRRRAGRSVLYFRTRAGDSVVAAAAPVDPLP
ncbi:ArsR/SmtB family transcription factor [uncultured Jatrophihabitans sp.]|uniref:ArsR/SmtB family transcription factor n=1 Tax=uncultured Jatrophihabitans sp. TaxID=1610747 RepID=UPI0035CA5188